LIAYFFGNIFAKNYQNRFMYARVVARQTTLCLKKFPPFNCLYLCQILTDFQQFWTAGKRTKFATKFVLHYAPHFRHVATLPWEIKNHIFCR